VADFNSFGSRRGNHEVMMRGTFGNIRLQNELVPGTLDGGVTHDSMPDGGQTMSFTMRPWQYQESEARRWW
jgi:aconitate hydratase